jgi:hypothetical protein
MAHRWKYDGDVNLEYGGTYWREDDADDYVLAVRVTPCSDAGGPDNKWHVESGSVYMPADKRDSWLDVIGVDPADATRRDYVAAAIAYHGIERDTYNGETIVQIGKDEESGRSGGWNPETDVQLRGNARLWRYVRNAFLS